MTLRPGPLVFGAVLILLSFHDLFVVSAAEMLVPINERRERPYFVVLGLVFAGLALVAWGCFADAWTRRGRGSADAHERDEDAHA